MCVCHVDSETNNIYLLTYSLTYLLTYLYAWYGGVMVTRDRLAIKRSRVRCNDLAWAVGKVVHTHVSCHQAV